MSSDDISIRAENLSKCYHLYERPGQRLRQFLMPRMQVLIGRDPKANYREFWALKEASFEVRRGETFGIVGRNGSGKSTLLQLLCGTLTPTAGQVSITGRVAALLELGSGFNPEFSGRENVYLNGAVLGMSHDVIQSRFEDIAAFADIGEFMDQPLKSYSSGMAVRLAFSVATYADADILVIDEALSVGDFAFQAKCMRRLNAFVSNGGTLLFVSHDTNAVKNLCSRAMFLQKGIVRSIGPSEEVCEQYLAETNREDGMASDFAPTSVAPVAQSDAFGVVDSREIERFRSSVAPFRRHASEVCEFVSARIVGTDGDEVNVASWGQAVRIKVKLQVNEPVENLVVAFYLRDRLQIDIMGTNTDYEHKELRDLSAGSLVEIDFDFMNYLRAGEYGLCLIAADKPIITNQYFDWIDVAATLKTADRGKQLAWAIFNPGIGVTIRKQA
ncbi:MAG: ABC transporter ATP-binding protein [Pseudoxanthomonas sp.]